MVTGEPSVADLFPRDHDVSCRVPIVLQRSGVSCWSRHHCHRTSCLPRSGRVEQQTDRLS